MDNKDFDFKATRVPFNESGLGHMSSKMDEQADELRRIDDAAERKAKLANDEANSAKKDARFSKRIAVISIIISLIALLLESVPSFIVWVLELLESLQLSK